jgi:hypothetical protein
LHRYGEVIAQTLGNLSTTLDLGAVYERLPAGVRWGCTSCESRLPIA